MSNPVTGKIHIECLLSTVLKKQIKEKDAGNGPLKTFVVRHSSVDSSAPTILPTRGSNPKHTI